MNIINDRCPTCNNLGYITKHYRVSPLDCYLCYAVICKLCGIYNEYKSSWRCNIHNED